MCSSVGFSSSYHLSTLGLAFTLQVDHISLSPAFKDTAAAYLLRVFEVNDFEGFQACSTRKGYVRYRLFVNTASYESTS